MTVSARDHWEYIAVPDFGFGTIPMDAYFGRFELPRVFDKHFLGYAFWHVECILQLDVVCCMDSSFVSLFICALCSCQQIHCLERRHLQTVLYRISSHNTHNPSMRKSITQTRVLSRRPKGYVVGGQAVADAILPFREPRSQATLALST